MTENSSFWAKKGRVVRVNFNLYHYAGNSPVKYVDPDGRELYIEGSDEYKNQVLKDIQKFAPNAKWKNDKKSEVIIEGKTKGYKEGNELIRKIVASDKKVIIKTGDKNGCVPQVKNPITGALLSEAQLSYYMNGTGNKASANVTYNFNLPETITREDGTKWNRPSYLGLAHELIHSEHSVYGNVAASLALEEKSTVDETDIIIAGLIKNGGKGITMRGSY